MIVKLLTEHHLEFLSLKGGCTGSSESTLVKMSNCWKSHAAAQMITDTGKTFITSIFGHSTQCMAHVVATIYAHNVTYLGS